MHPPTLETCELHHLWAAYICLMEQLHGNNQNVTFHQQQALVAGCAFGTTRWGPFASAEAHPNPRSSLA